MTNAEETQVGPDENTNFQAMSSIPGQTSIWSEDNVPISDWQVSAMVMRELVRALSHCDVKWAWIENSPVSAMDCNVPFPEWEHSQAGSFIWCATQLKCIYTHPYHTSPPAKIYVHTQEHGPSWWVMMFVPFLSQSAASSNSFHQVPS